MPMCVRCLIMQQNSKKVDDFLYEKDSYNIRGACFEVYNNLGGGIKEKLIERALSKELETRNFKVNTQVRIPIMYKGEKIGIYIPDIVINDQSLLEIKSKP